MSRKGRVGQGDSLHGIVRDERATHETTVTGSSESLHDDAVGRILHATLSITTAVARVSTVQTVRINAIGCGKCNAAPYGVGDEG